ncbi:carbohydrate binding family 9 domain-containing protein [Paraglaciecola arctica]|uniref:carbohydrate binding family 9 domain-containing protein n=1 Tax=Paraglaciecola arctica TaxID=1128911 RepID=UPI001C06DE30|nr:carbohydrate binding family 9 domain-containing protein [Paraglaciecola arctica]MBU3003896.1 carbohydrate binding family 9 domain-containing protein [Paraglaciecola arctica]
MPNLLICLLLFIGCINVALAKQNKPKSPRLPHFALLDIPNIAADIIVDGELDEEQWGQAKELELNYVTSPFENTRPPVTTKVKMFENGHTLFVAFIAQDPKVENINAFYRDRDGIWSDDLVGIKLDTFNDSRLAYQFFVNPLGIQADSIQNEMTGSESDSWDGIWQSAGKIVASGYQVEIAIPLRILNFEEGDKHKVWGAELVRFFPRTDRLRISNMPLDRNNSCALCQMGAISGFKKAKQGKNLALIPTLVLGKGQSREPEDSLIWEDSDNKELGLDLKWGITPEVSLQATLNPDFSQVEADVAQLSINDTFALFFDEKRTFFLENSDYFSSNFDLVYTRNVGAPDYGAKVTGRIDQHTFGVFVANDNATTFLVPGNLGSSIASFEEESTNVALRYRYDLSENLSLGLTSTLRDAQDYYNYVNGIDAKYQLTDKDTFRAQVLRSDTQYPIDLYKEFCDDNCEQQQDYSETALRLNKNEAFSGKAYRLSYDHDERNWDFSLYRNSRGTGIRTDLGFGSLADRHQSVIGGGYNWFSENTWWNKIRLSGDWDISHNDNGELLEKEAEAYLSMNGQLQSYFEIGLLKRDRVGLRDDPSKLSIVNNSTLFTEKMLSFYFEMRPNSSWYLSTFSRFGDQIDFDNNRLGELLLLRPTINWNLGKSLQFKLRHTYQNLDVENQQLFTANLSDFRATYQFDQRQFLRLILVYSDIERNQQNYNFDVDAKSKGLGTQLLYSYKLNPLTKFFVGYSDSAYQDDVLTTLTKNQRSVFMKLSYAWLN